jgi:predicted alpha/beta-fold hydrolase
VSVSNGYALSQLSKSLQCNPTADLLLATFTKEILYDRLPEIEKNLACATGKDPKEFMVRLMESRSMRDFDAVLAPLFGFVDVDAYYDAQSCAQCLDRVKAPLLLVGNFDDPIIGPNLLRHGLAAVRTNPRIIMVSTTRGGHLGWLQGTFAEPWLHKLLTEFLTEALRNGAFTGTR